MMSIFGDNGTANLNKIKSKLTREFPCWPTRLWSTQELSKDQLDQYVAAHEDCIKEIRENYDGQFECLQCKETGFKNFLLHPENSTASKFIKLKAEFKVNRPTDEVLQEVLNEQNQRAAKWAEIWGQRRTAGKPLKGILSRTSSVSSFGDLDGTDFGTAKVCQKTRAEIEHFFVHY